MSIITAFYAIRDFRNLTKDFIFLYTVAIDYVKDMKTIKDETNLIELVCYKKETKHYEPITFYTEAEDFNNDWYIVNF